MSSPILEAILTSHESALRPERALVFYTRGSALEMVTAHDVRDTRGGPALGPGHPLSPEDELEIVRLLHSADTAPAVIEVFPPGLLALDRFQMAWWVPPAVRPMHFHAHGPDGARRWARNVRWPGLVLRVVGHELFVAAVAGDERPSAATPLVKAPIANMWANGQMCAGNAVLPKDMMIADIPAFEAVVFDSAFSHANDRDVVRKRGKPVDPMVFWQSADASFAPSNAVPLHLTLGQWLAESPDKEKH